MTTVCVSRPQLAGLSAPTPADDFREPAHPAAGTPPEELVAHLQAMHHRSLRERLRRIQSLLAAVAASHKTSGRWRAVCQQFSDLHEEFGCCLHQEHSVVFAHVAKCAVAGAQRLPGSLKAVERLHARLVKQLWALREQIAAAPAHGMKESLTAELADLLDDFYQHLFEEECLLFPQLAGLGAAS